MYRILVCDDDHDIVSAIDIYLRSEGYEVLKAYDGQEALALIDKDIQLVIMDIMMPNMDGMTAMVEIRKNYNVPVIFLSAKSEDTDKILGLTVGADDYVTKPFNPVELMARVKSQLRRYTQLGSAVKEVEIAENVFIQGGIKMDDNAKMVYLDGEEVALTKTEYDILKLFLAKPGVVYSPQEIYSAVWNDVAIGNEGTVAVHIRHLREKIEINPADPRYIKVVWGRGYKLES